MKELNKDVRTRDRLIFGEYNEYAYGGGVRHFEDLSLATLEKLVAQDFIDLDDQQNDCPTVQAILGFMRTYPDYTAHGYTVSIERGDYRVSLEGVAKDREADTPEELKGFIELFRFADDFCVEGEMYCWFD